MSISPARVPARPPDLREAPARLIGKYCFGMSAATALGGVVALGALPYSGIGLHGIVLLFGLLCGAAFWLSHRPGFPIGSALFGVALAGILLCGAVDWTLGHGLRSPITAFYALAICVVGAIVGLRASLPLAAVALLQSVALRWLDPHGLAATAGLPNTMPISLALLFQALVIGCSVAAGALIAHVIEHYLRAAAEREQRFHGLLRIAADWYWEQDHLLRFTQISESNPGTGGFASVAWHKRTLWQLPGIEIAAPDLAAHHADLESHLPFSGLLVQRLDPQGQARVYSLSGEPKWDTDGAFRGYWGVAREVTREMSSQRALAASEKRYRELFSRSPSPIVLHRHGCVVDANEAAARLFGFTDAAAMEGFDCLVLWPEGEARQRALARLDELESLPLGGALPVLDSQVRAIDGHLLSLQSTAVRVETASGPANLSIFFDITARQTAEGALRRSEAMLSHLFATSPDGIALIEMPSRRFAMLNPAFCRLSGFRADEATGHTPAELGLWDDARSEDELVERLERQRTVVDFATRFVVKSRAVLQVLLAAGRFRMDQRDYLVINARDITANERTRLEHAAILARASIGIAFTRDRRIVQANPFFEAMFGWPMGSLARQPDALIWPADEAGGAIGELAARALAAGTAFEIEREMRRADKSLFWCRLLAQAVDLADPVRSGTIWIAEDVTERRRLDQALAAARDAAEAANLAKTAFLANTNHEIRTPLNGLLGLARLALQPELPEERRRDYLAQILESAQGLADVMSDILDVSKIEAGQIALDDVAFDLRETLEAVHRAHRQAADSKGVDLRLEIDPRVPATVRGDPVRLRQIVSNFVSNALKFTARGAVIVSAGPTARGDIRLAVTDTGPGVDPATQQRLFTPFSQGDSSTTRRFGGVGLGLSICRDLAHLMGGRVGVLSRRGEGSTFWAELPLPAAGPAPPVLRPQVDDAAVLRDKRVLVVEDNPVNMMIVVAMLDQWGMQVTEATDGRMAVDRVHEAARRGTPFDAVLMDLQMPVMGGHEATRQLRRHFPPAVLPIIALTAAALVSEREEALLAGMDDFLTKPIDAVRLRQTLVRRVGDRIATGASPA